MTDPKKSVSLATQIQWVLMDSPRPLFLGEITNAVNALDSHGGIPSSEVMSTFIWLINTERVGYEMRERNGKGVKIAKAYFYLSPSDMFEAQNHG